MTYFPSRVPVSHLATDKEVSRMSTRRKKLKALAAFARAKRQLYSTLEYGDASKSHVRQDMESLTKAMEYVLDVTENLRQHYQTWGEVDKLAGLEVELNRLEMDFVTAESDANQYCAGSYKRVRQENRPQPSHSGPGHMDLDQLETEVQAMSRELHELNVASEFKPATTAAMQSGLGDTRLSQRSPLQSLESEYRPPFMPSSTPYARQPTPTFPERPTRYTPNGPMTHQPMSFAPNQGYTGMPSPVGASPYPPYVPQVPLASTQMQGPYYSQPNTALFHNDSSRLLTRVPIPKFAGNKKNYESWKAAFMACVDNATVAPEYKLLRLRDSLEGEALRVIESLGHSATAYEIAKECKYGGAHHQMILRLEEIDRFKQVQCV